MKIIMNKIGFSLFWILLVLVSLLKFNFALQHRSKRFFLFPRASSQAAELTVGLGVPVEVNPESVTIGFALQTNFLLPSNVSQLWSHLADPFDVSDQSNEKRSIERGRFRELRDDYDEQKQSFHKYSTKSDVRSKRANNSASMRWTVYKALAKVAERYGFIGRSCVLRSICEYAQTSVDYSSGILGELFHVVMTPSLTNEEIIDHEDNEYLHAESIGNNGAPCHHIFSECKISLLDIFTRMDTTTMN